MILSTELSDKKEVHHSKNILFEYIEAERINRPYMAFDFMKESFLIDKKIDNDRNN